MVSGLARTGEIGFVESEHERGLVAENLRARQLAAAVASITLWYDMTLVNGLRRRSGQRNNAPKLYDGRAGDFSESWSGECQVPMIAIVSAIRSRSTTDSARILCMTRPR